MCKTRQGNIALGNYEMQTYELTEEDKDENGVLSEFP